MGLEGLSGIAGSCCNPSCFFSKGYSEGKRWLIDNIKSLKMLFLASRLGREKNIGGLSWNFHNFTVWLLGFKKNFGRTKMQMQFVLYLFLLFLTYFTFCLSKKVSSLEDKTFCKWQILYQLLHQKCRLFVIWYFAF